VLYFVVFVATTKMSVCVRLIAGRLMREHYVSGWVSSFVCRISKMYKPFHIWRRRDF